MEWELDIWSHCGMRVRSCCFTDRPLKLHLKFLIGDGSSFLKSPTDHISLAKTHSLRWLAQIVCQIIRAVKWESDFRCEGVASLAGFKRGRTSHPLARNDWDAGVRGEAVDLEWARNAGPNARL